MVSYKKLMQAVLNTSNSQRIELGQRALADTVNILTSKGVDEENTTLLVINLIKLFVSADQECSEEEYNIVKAITDVDVSEDEFYEITNGGADPKFVEKFLDIISYLDDEERSAIAMFGLSILASDEILTKEEQELFVKICG